MAQKYKVLLVSSSGGVLLDLLALGPWWSQQDVTWAAVEAPDTNTVLMGHTVHWVQERGFNRPWGVIPGVFEAYRVLRMVRPQVIVSAGTGVAIGFFLAARLLGIPTFWLETFNIIDRTAMAGRICSRLASQSMVQRPSMLRAHPDAEIIGELY